MTKVILLGTVAFFAALNVQAYFAPSTGTWPNRDPLHEVGSRAWEVSVTTPATVSWSQSFGIDETIAALGGDRGLNLYLFVNNCPLLNFDGIGTGINCSCVPPQPLPSSVAYFGMNLGSQNLNYFNWVHGFTETSPSFTGHCELHYYGYGVICETCYWTSPCTYVVTFTVARSNNEGYGPNYYYWKPQLRHISGHCW